MKPWSMLLIFALPNSSSEHLTITTQFFWLNTLRVFLYWIPQEGQERNLLRNGLSIVSMHYCGLWDPTGSVPYYPDVTWDHPPASSLWSKHSDHSLICKHLKHTPVSGILNTASLCLKYIIPRLLQLLPCFPRNLFQIALLPRFTSSSILLYFNALWLTLQ